MELFKPLINHQEIHLLNENIYNQPLSNHINDNLLDFHQNKFWIIEITLGNKNLPPLNLGNVFHYQSNKMVYKDHYPFNNAIKIPLIQGDISTIVLNTKDEIEEQIHGDFLYFPHWQVKIFHIQTDKNNTIIKGQIGNYN